MKKLIQLIVSKILRPKWVVLDSYHADINTCEHELVLIIWGVKIGHYKGDVIYFTDTDVPRLARQPKKHEFTTCVVATKVEA